MKNIVISPFSRKLRSSEENAENAKNYPYWDQVVKILREQGNKVVQIGVEGEREIGAEFLYYSLTLDSLRILLEAADVWISVDNFINHFGTFIGKKGIVIFGQSDPKIFGYEQNINLLKDRKYLRELQFAEWEGVEYNKDAFVDPGVVVDAVNDNF